MPGKRQNRRGKLRSLLPAVAFLAPFLSAATGTDFADKLAWLDAVFEQLDANSLARKAELEAIHSIRVPPEVGNLGYARTPITADNVVTGAQSSAENWALIAGLVFCGVGLVALWAMARNASYHQREVEHESDMAAVAQLLARKGAKVSKLCERVQTSERGLQEARERAAEAKEALETCQESAKEKQEAMLEKERRTKQRLEDLVDAAREDKMRLESEEAKVSRLGEQGEALSREFGCLKQEAGARERGLQEATKEATLRGMRAEEALRTCQHNHEQKLKELAKEREEEKRRAEAALKHNHEQKLKELATEREEEKRRAEAALKGLSARLQEAQNAAAEMAEELDAANRKRSAASDANDRLLALRAEKEQELQAQVDALGGQLAKAVRDKEEAVRDADAATDAAGRVQTQLTRATQAVQDLRAERNACVKSGKTKPSTETPGPKPVYCYAAGCTISRRARYWFHGSGANQRQWCPRCFSGLKDGQIAVLEGKPIFKAQLKMNNGDKNAQRAVAWKSLALLRTSGLENPKNWCGLLSIVQVLGRWELFLKKALMAKGLEEEATDDEPGPTPAQPKLSEAGSQECGPRGQTIMSMFGGVFTTMEDAPEGTSPGVPEGLAEKLGNNELMLHQQADAGEVLLSILEKLTGKADVDQTGVGEEALGETTVKTSCGCKRDCTDELAPFQVLMLPVGAPVVVKTGQKGQKQKGQKKGAKTGGGATAATLSLTDLLVKHFKGPAACDRCCSSGKRKGTQRSNTTILTKTPSKLFIQLERVHFVGDRVVKAEDKVDIPLVLDLGPFTAGGTGDDAIYDVDATIHHLGSSSTNGHYTAYARVEGDEWCCFDDQSVTTVGVDQALAKPSFIISYTKRP